MLRVLWFAVLIAVGVMGAGGCSNEGGVELSWEFDGSEPAWVGCGRHGVDSVLVTGANDAGDGANMIAVCTAGSLKRTVPVGRWMFALHTLDIRGRLIRALEDPDAVTETLEVAEGGTAMMFAVANIVPRPACADGVDNDRDGRVDLTDPDCADTADTDESPASQP
jgi:hypothetical protein